MKNLHELDKFREKHPYWPQTDKAGAFRVYVNDRSFEVLANVDDIGCNGQWEHICVIMRNQMQRPTWEDMAAIKDMFFGPEEEAVQFLPEHQESVNYREYYLHIWRPVDGKLLRSPEGKVSDMATLAGRDAQLEAMWHTFADVPIDPGTGKTEAAFMDWPAGTDREAIWHWFDVRHSKGVAYLLYGDGFDRTPEQAKLMYLKNLCIECESSSCQFNRGGECRFALVHERKPRINDYDGCIDFDYREGDD